MYFTLDTIISHSPFLREYVPGNWDMRYESMEFFFFHEFQENSTRNEQQQKNVSNLKNVANMQIPRTYGPELFGVVWSLV